MQKTIALFLRHELFLLLNDIAYSEHTVTECGTQTHHLYAHLFGLNTTGASLQIPSCHFFQFDYIFQH